MDTVGKKWSEERGGAAANLVPEDFGCTQEGLEERRNKQGVTFTPERTEVVIGCAHDILTANMQDLG